ncbi:MAG: efflux RND transporter periplasmic adaptor subunit [Nitrospirae bacterium]|nr:efflux RND transporter periplasmic adaptor subunit [Nitrospirota bacterium]
MANEDLSKLRIDKSQATAAPGKRRKSIYRGLALLLIVLAAGLYWAGFLSPAQTVEVTSVSLMYPSQTFTDLNASGYVVAQRKAAVASKVTGRLVAMLVEEGSKIKKGQVLARLENDDSLAAVAQAEANLNAARSNLKQAQAELHDAELTYGRNKELMADGLISRSIFDSSDARYKKASASVDAAEAAVSAQEAALRSAQVSLEYTFVRAPFDAVVLTKNADAGDIVTPIGAAANAKSAVVTIADMGSLQVEADVSESGLHNVSVGQPCEIQLDAFPDLRFRGELHMIVPTADRSKATVLVKVRFIDKDDRILPEMSAKVAFLSRQVGPGEQEPRMVVNPSAIMDRNGRKAVFLIKDDRLVEKEITTGEMLGDMVKVSAGLDAGDRVVLKPSAKLKDKDRVKIAEQ